MMFPNIHWFKWRTKKTAAPAAENTLDDQDLNKVSGGAQGQAFSGGVNLLRARPFQGGLDESAPVEPPDPGPAPTDPPPPRMF